MPLHLTLGSTQGKRQPGSPVFPPRRAGRGGDPEPSASIAVELRGLAGPSPAQLAARFPVPAGLDRQGWCLGRGRRLRPGDDDESSVSALCTRVSATKYILPGAYLPPFPLTDGQHSPCLPLPVVIFILVPSAQMVSIYYMSCTMQVLGVQR